MVFGKMMEKTANGKMDREELKPLLVVAKRKLGCCFYFYAICVFPLIALLALGFSVATVASLVFGIQALVVGSATYEDEPCQRTIGVWMIVHGSLAVGGALLHCLCDSHSSKKKKQGEDAGDGDEKGSGICGCFSGLVSMASIGWLLYGVYLVYDNPAPYQLCNESQFEVFRMIVQFNFFIGLAMLGLGAIVMVCLCPGFCIVGLDALIDDQKNDPEANLKDLKAGGPNGEASFAVV